MINKTALAVILTLALPAAAWGANSNSTNNSQQQQQSSMQQSKDSGGNQSGQSASQAGKSGAGGENGKMQADQQKSPSSSGGSSGQFIAKEKPDQMTASDKIIGMAVNNHKDQEIGNISDLILNKDGQVKGVVISVGGFLGIGSKNVALPWGAVQFSSGKQGKQKVMVDKTQKELENAPSFKTNAEQQQKQQAAQQKAKAKQQQQKAPQQQGSGSSLPKQPPQSQQKQQ